jgi:hypothetical protein
LPLASYIVEGPLHRPSRVKAIKVIQGEVQDVYPALSKSQRGILKALGIRVPGHGGLYNHMRKEEVKNRIYSNLI